jgi:hypothetical protein
LSLVVTPSAGATKLSTRRANKNRFSPAADFSGSGGPAIISNVLKGGDIIQITAMVPNGIVARRSVAAKNKDTVIRVIKLTAESIKLVQTDREFSKKVIMKWMPIKDPEMLEQVYRFATEDYSKEGFVPESALRSMTKQMVQSNLIDATAAAETPVTAYYDNGYVEEVKRSGFFDQLWR